MPEEVEEDEPLIWADVPEIEIDEEEDDIIIDEEENRRTTLGDLDALQELRDQINQQRSTE